MDALPVCATAESVALNRSWGADHLHR